MLAQKILSYGLMIALFISSCTSLEEAERAIYLQPRNFNPHPYQIGYENEIKDSSEVEPILFPKTSLDPGQNYQNFQNVHGNGDKSFIDSNAYTSLVRKYKYKQSGRFNYNLQENHSNTQALRALSSHAERILQKPSQEVTNPTYSHEPNIYAFSYKVQDQQSGDDFSHVQQQNSKATNGEYRVKLPDGRVQIVSYVADNNGYKADVKYTEEKHIQPLRPIPPNNENIDYVYNYQPPLGHNYESPSKYKNENLYNTANYENQIQINPYVVINNNEKNIPQHNIEYFPHNNNQEKLVQINRNSFNNNKIEGFIGSTLAPYILDNSKGFQENVLSTVSPNFERYNQFHIKSQHVQFLTDKSHLLY